MEVLKRCGHLWINQDLVHQAECGRKISLFTYTDLGVGGKIAFKQCPTMMSIIILFHRSPESRFVSWDHGLLYSFWNELGLTIWWWKLILCPIFGFRVFFLSVSSITVSGEMSNQINAVSSYLVLINYKPCWFKIWSGLWYTKWKPSWLKHIWKTQHGHVSLYFHF